MEGAMGEIVDLTSLRGHKLTRIRAEKIFGPAQVVLYTGVRYEREEPIEPEPTNKKSSPRKRKRKLS